MDFAKRYDGLNPAQQQAVDTVDGPVMVIAGPGTGKTELLSMRVANILRTTDALPQNILCLTYTESGAFAMRERLAGLIGPDAYKVAIHTFHSFGAEIINHNAEYFYHGAHFRPADELSSYEILQAIFEKLPHDNPLAKTMNDTFTYLRDTQSAISDLKKSGLTSDELAAILDRNEAFISWLQPRLAETFADRLSKKTFPGAQALLDEIEHYDAEPLELITYEPLHALVYASLATALERSIDENSTKPLSAWKREWCEKRENGELTLKDEKRCKRLRAVANIYNDYLLAMQARELYDFDDMILRTIHAMEIFHDLRLNLQEQYQYILVDEFQDTNDAQMRLVWNLTNNASMEGRPNVMVVGDDDQAIYRFQGANLSNILEYRNLYRDVAVITLTENYRSAAPILAVARDTITQAEERLEHTIEGVDKALRANHNPTHPQVSFTSYADEASEFAAIAKQIRTQRDEHPEQSIAIIARHHRQLQAIVPYLQSERIAMSYDRRDNVLDIPPVQFLELLSRVVALLGEQRLNDANALLPELLAHPAWAIPPRELWQLSLTSFSKRQPWLETMLASDGKLGDIAAWIMYSAQLAQHEPLERIIDHLTGTDEDQVANTETEEPENGIDAVHEGFHSPLRDYFFAHELLDKKPATYIAYLDALSSIRHHVRTYRPEGQLQLRDFIYCLDRYRELGISIQASSHITSKDSPVELLTAHRSKGLEFDTVYVINLIDTIWGETARSRAKLISYPHNLPIGITGDSSDEHIRLLFVALTRAKTNLFMSYYRTAAATNKAMLPCAYLGTVPATEKEGVASSIAHQELAWHAGLSAITEHSMEELLQSTLETYKLSATHLGNFLDVSRGGPELFLLQNLLRFPQAMSPSASFGSAIHATLQRAHGHLTATGNKRPIEDVLGDFEVILGEYQLTSDDFGHYLKKGSDVLGNFLTKRYESFSPTQRVEQNFAGDAVIVGEARLSGAIDLMDIDEENKTITVTDYKTGKSVANWKGRTDYEKIKLHHYRQQLMFYKLLIENSRRFTGYTVTKGFIEFVEPDEQGAINRIEIDYDRDELAEFTKLIGAVWSRIQTLDFTLLTEYDKSLKGIQSFELDILS